MSAVSVLALADRSPCRLRPVVEAMRAHFKEVEPQMDAAWICMGLGTSGEDRDTLRSIGWDVLVLLKEPRSVGTAMNRLIAAVRTPYLLILQEGWKFRNPQRAPFTREAASVLASDPRFAHVRLDDGPSPDVHNRTTYDGPFSLPGSSATYYVQNPRACLGGFTLAPGLTRTEALHRIGPFDEEPSHSRERVESDYSPRFARQFYTVRIPSLCLFFGTGQDSASTDAAGVTRASRQASAERSAPSAGTAAPPGAFSDRPVEVGGAASVCERKDGQASPPKVACLMAAYRRPQHLRAQWEALKAQSIRVDEIALWLNYHPDAQFEEDLLREIPHVRSTNRNWGVWPRFLFAYELDAEFICVLDDDTIPGSRWIENCLRTMQDHEGLLGTVGIIFPRGTRGPQYKVGWPNPRNEVTEVDIVSHAWFFRRDWLRYYVVEPRQSASTCGEDYHFSVALQKHLGLGTYVPPHDPSDRSEWGSTHGDLGVDPVALYLQPGESEKKEAMHNAYLRAGWKPLALRTGRWFPTAAAGPDATNSATRIRQVSAMRFEQDFVRDLEKINFRGAPFAFARFGDGEFALCAGRPVRASDGWSYAGGPSPFVDKLREALCADLQGYYLGISCPCCHEEAHQWYLQQIRAPRERITFATLFVNANYERFRQLDLSRTVLVASRGGDFTVPPDAVNAGFDYEPLLEDLLKVDRTILLAAGPLACILVYEYWRRAQRPQVIVDIGSTLDPVLFGRSTRGYHRSDGPTSRKVCVWSRPLL